MSPFHHLLQEDKPMQTGVHASTSLKQLHESILPKESGRKENTAPDVACQTQGPDAEGKMCSSPMHQRSSPTSVMGKLLSRGATD